MVHRSIHGPVLLFVLLGTLISFLTGCARDSASIVSVQSTPLVAVHYPYAMEPLVSEGVGLALLVDGIDPEEHYQIALTSVGDTFHWESTVTPFEISGAWYVGVPDLLLPLEHRLPRGTWTVELFSSDGVRNESEFVVDRPSHVLNQAYLRLAYLPELSWQQDGEQWHLSGVPAEDEGMWRYTFYNGEGVAIHTTDSRQENLSDPVLTTGTIKERTQLIVGTHYDPVLDCFFMIRKEFKESGPQTPTVADE